MTKHKKDQNIEANYKTTNQLTLLLEFGFPMPD